MTIDEVEGHLNELEIMCRSASDSFSELGDLPQLLLVQLEIRAFFKGDLLLYTLLIFRHKTEPVEEGVSSRGLLLSPPSPASALSK